MRNMKKLLLGILFTLCIILPCTVFALPEEINLWGKEPVVKVSETRQEIVLNGCWKFMPASGASEKEPQEESWGSLFVPGTWRTGWGLVYNSLTYGSGENWDVPAMNQVDLAWYQRDIYVPADWKGKEIVLDLKRVSTDAIVYVDGQECGNVTWPGGTVNITDYVKYGEKSVLRILVAATNDSELFVHDWGNGTTSIESSSVTERGLLDDVILYCRNKDNYIESMWVKTFVGDKRMEIDVDFVDITEKQTADVKIDVVDWKTNRVERSFNQQIEVEPGTHTQTVDLKYITQKLWDVGQPNLYNLVFTIKGKTIDDQFVQRFGFREFEIRGRDFYLNGTKIHLRNWQFENGATGVRELAEKRFDMYMANGINCMEIWPGGNLSKGTTDFWPMYAEIADEKGMLMMMPGASVDSYIPWRGTFGEGEYEDWLSYLIPYLKRTRNSPANVVNVATSNRYSHGNVLNPRTLGNREALNTDDPYHLPQIPDIELIFGTYHKLDPTRPAMSHQGGNAGDIHTTNIYLNFVQLQEREDLLSAWAEDGDMPYMACEFGTPLNLSFGRTRNQSRALSFQSEPLATEFATIYFGNDPYYTEDNTDAGMIYKRAIASRYHENNTWNLCYEQMHDLDSFSKIQSLMIGNVLRAWRTWGLSGGVIPWWSGHGWKSIPNDWPTKPPLTFTPGMRGVYSTNMRVSGFTLEMTDQYAYPHGKTMVEVYQPTLAWIVGTGESFTLKDHHYYSGDTLKKQINIQSDTRKDEKYSIKWIVNINGEKYKASSMGGTIKTGEILFLPFEVKLPEVTETTDAEIVMEAKIGENIHNDQFAFRIYPKVEKNNQTYMVFDPNGDTSAYLESLGATLVPWDKNNKEQDVLIIGRDALQYIADQMQDVLSFARNGGKVLIFGQEETIMKEKMAMRVCEAVSRRFWPVENMKDHPIIQGLDGEDFRDWNGSGSLLPFETGTSFEEYKARTVAGGNYPEHYFHWGNRGSVASTALEKIENSSWRAILEGEFDMNFSPLLERSIGKGYMLWCALDVEARSTVEPVADIVTTRMLDYIKNPTIIPEAKTYVIGDNAYADEVGLIYEKVNAMPAEIGLVVLGRGHGVADSAIESYIAKGGNVVILGSDATIADPNGKLPFDLVAVMGEYNGCLESLPYPEFKSVSISDTRVRVPFDVPLLTTSKKAQILLNGTVARIENNGVAVLFQLTPDMIDIVTHPYLRYTQWHNSYMINQVLANLGATFTPDEWIWKFDAESMKDKEIGILTGWTFKEEYRVPAMDTGGILVDQPNKGFENGWHLPEFDDSDWGDAEAAFDKMPDYEGAVWFRKKVYLTADMLDKDLLLGLGTVDDCDITYFNGVEVGRTGRETESYWGVDRRYNLPKEILREGENVIAIRCFDEYGGGGLYGNSEQMKIIRFAEEIDYALPYHIGYDYTFDEGDDPYRFHSW